MTFKPGDVVELRVGDENANWMDKNWNGFRATVIRVTPNKELYLEPIGLRPDGFSYNFFWSINNIVVPSNVKDFRDQPIKVGDTVVYPGRQGSSLWLNEGVVVGFGEREWFSWEKNPHTLSYDRIPTKFPTLKIRRTNGRTVTVEVLGRVVKV